MAYLRVERNSVSAGMYSEVGKVEVLSTDAVAASRCLLGQILGTVSELEELLQAICLVSGKYSTKQLILEVIVHGTSNIFRSIATTTIFTIITPLQLLLLTWD